MSERRVHTVGDFFNDGPVYLLYSSSLGGSGMTAAQLEEVINSDDPAEVRHLLERGVCLPLYFPGDCALDQAVIVEGDLTESEEAEWIGRLRARLEIPCGEFILQAFGQAHEIEEATTHDHAPDLHAVHFVKVQLAPGSYLIEVYAFVSSTTVNDFWGGPDGVDEVVGWWHRSRPGTEPPQWLEDYQRDGYVQSEQGLLEYLIRLVPAKEDIPIPRQEDELGLGGVFEERRPTRCPVGIALDSVV